jgi:hypothetical protein
VIFHCIHDVNKSAANVSLSSTLPIWCVNVILVAHSEKYIAF